MPTLETDRLLMRAFEEEDLDQYAAIMADPEVVRYLGHDPLSREDAWRDWAFEVFGADELLSVVHRDNQRSARVAQRVGHEAWRELEVRGNPCVLYGQRRQPVGEGRPDRALA